MRHLLSSRLCDDTLEFLLCSRSAEFDFYSGRTQEVAFTQNLNNAEESRNKITEGWIIQSNCFSNGLWFTDNWRAIHPPTKQWPKGEGLNATLLYTWALAEVFLTSILFKCHIIFIYTFKDKTFPLMMLRITHRSWDWEASENKVDIFFFCADVTHSIDMKVNTGWLWWKFGTDKLISKGLNDTEGANIVQENPARLCLCLLNNS